MRIDSVELFRVPLSAVAGEGEPPESIFVVLQSGRELGIGEATLSRGPTQAAEWAGGAWTCLRDWLCPAMKGQTVASGNELQQLLSKFQGNARAKSALDLAWWNLAARVEGKSLVALVGGQEASLALGATFDVMASIDELLAAVAGSLAAGYANVTLKFRPGWDIQMVKAVRESFPHAVLAIDCDGLCSLAQQETFYRLQDFFLESIEQPLDADDLVGHAMLQESIRTPIVLDQSAASPKRVELAIDLGSCRRVRIDVARVGGITPALAIREACELSKIAWAVGGGPHGALAAYATLAVATASPATVPALACQALPWPGGGPGGALIRLGSREGRLFAELAADEGADPAAMVRWLAAVAVERAKIS